MVKHVSRDRGLEYRDTHKRDRSCYFFLMAAAGLHRLAVHRGRLDSCVRRPYHGFHIRPSHCSLWVAHRKADLLYHRSDSAFSDLPHPRLFHFHNSPAVEDSFGSVVGTGHARHYLRHELASRLILRHVPELHFTQDKNPDVESRIDFLLKRAKRSRGREAS